MYYRYETEAKILHSALGLTKIINICKVILIHLPKSLPKTLVIDSYLV